MLLCGELQPDDADEQQPHENKPRDSDRLLEGQSFVKPSDSFRNVDQNTSSPPAMNR